MKQFKQFFIACGGICLVSLFLIDLPRYQRGDFDKEPMLMLITLVRSYGAFIASPIVIFFCVSFERNKLPTTRTKWLANFIFWFAVCSTLFWSIGMVYADQHIGAGVNVFVIIAIFLNLFVSFYTYERIVWNGIHLLVTLVLVHYGPLKDTQLDTAYSFIFGGTIAAMMLGHNRFTSIVNEFVANQLLEESNKKYETANNDLKNYLHILSHDLKEPIRNINGMSAVLKNSLKRQAEGITDAQNECFDYLQNSTKRIGKLVDDLNEFATVGQDNIEVEWFDGGIIRESVTHNLHNLIEREGANVQWNHFPEKVFGSPTLLSQLFQNLINNAVKFKKDDQLPKVEISSTTNKDSIHFVISDNGIGVAEENLEKIFKPLQRLEKQRFEGSGLGLSICQNIVEKHRGKIWMESKLGIGSQVHIVLPNSKSSS